MQKRLAYISLVITIIIWGGTFIAASIGLQELTPYQLATARFVVATALFLPILAVLYRQGQRLDRRDLPVVVLLAFLGVTTYFYLQFGAVSLAGPMPVAVLVALSPVWVATFGHFFLGERLNRRAVAGIIIGCLGAMIIATKGSFSFAGAPGVLAGAGLAIVNTFEWATYTVIGRRVLRRYPPLFLTACIAVAGTAMLIPLSLLLGAFPSSWAFQPRTWGAVIYLGAISSVLCYTLWYNALKHIEASRVAIFQYFQPGVSILVAWAVLGQRPSPSLLIGGAIVITGVATVARSRSIVNAAPEPSTPASEPAEAKATDREPLP